MDEFHSLQSSTSQETTTRCANFSYPPNRSTSRIRDLDTLNLGILAHVDAGKTSLTERLLYAAGVIDQVGRVDDGSTQTDTLALERLAASRSSPRSCRSTSTTSRST